MRDIETLRHLTYGLGTEERKEALAALEGIEKTFSDYEALDILRVEAEFERDDLRAKLEKAKEALLFYADTFGVKGGNGDEVRVPDFYNELDFGDRASRAIAELSADAPALQTQISDEAVADAAATYRRLKMNGNTDDTAIRAAIRSLKRG